jgi:hypothetical protein
MVYLLQKLSPKFYKKGTKLLRENENLTEVNFIMKGVIFVGIELNHEPKYIYAMKNGGLIGGYYCAYNLRSQEIYEC